MLYWTILIASLLHQLVHFLTFLLYFLVTVLLEHLDHACFSYLVFLLANALSNFKSQKVSTMVITLSRFTVVSRAAKNYKVHAHIKDTQPLL